MLFSPTNIVLTIVIIWLALLNFYLFKIVAGYKKLAHGTKNLNLEQILEGIHARVDLSEKRVNQLVEEIAKLEIANKFNIQKHALIRFNPFEDTGGDQSFVAAFLDGENNGIVISSLHTRNGTRVYAKNVISAKAGSHQFSKEEKEVVEKAAHRV
ncbi:hypothetical protein A2870_00365 [Candidatus Curtissbacteria bacterium RIFCSPHIGHO2_01_FULL_41_11]|uniref:DUF4446 domain-containing protein n=1 Tax=Candidatus Curtissbacteria bacterium RIFCSPHIGHO2_01_FULL_41_11 TaxID=1797711 RepID=A0A1F5G540_9BACT|nr:MAG: hypothetical protein A2870_00365 [Candidatus Curtissbacteria bacterium RIFCSPHIGHO2_01_FULL_41_11]